MGVRSRSVLVLVLWSRKGDTGLPFHCVEMDGVGILNKGDSSFVC